MSLPITPAMSTSAINIDDLITTTTILSGAIIAILVAEGIKILIPLRRWFNSAELRSWLSEDVMDRLMNAAASERAVERHAILQQPTPKLMGILQTTATYVLESRSDELLLRSLANVRLALTDSPDDVKLWMSATPRDETAFVARDRLEARIERRLDALQARLDYRWTLLNRYSTATVAWVVGSIVFRRTIQNDLYLGLGCVAAVVLVAAVGSAVIENVARRRIDA